MASDKYYKSPKPPGTREDDSWLSDEQLARCAPAEEEPFQSPVPTRMVSNGEYMPFPQTQKQKQVEQRIQQLTEKVCKKAASAAARSSVDPAEWPPPSWR